MKAIGVGVGIPFGRSRGWTTRNAIYLAATRNGDTIPEVNGNDIKILPAVFKGNGSGYYRNASINALSSDDWTWEQSVEISVPANDHYAFLGQGSSYFRLNKTNNRWEVVITDGTNNRSFNVSAATLPIENRVYNFKIVHDKDGSTTLYEGGVSKGSTSGTFGNIGNANTMVGSYGGVNIINSSFKIITTKFYSDTEQAILKASYVHTGNPVIEIDISGNNFHLLAISITSANRGWSANGSRYLLDNGWALWQHATTGDISAAVSSTTNPISTGYSITKVYGADVNGLNMAECLIGFNESGSDADALKIFDRSNTDIFEDAARLGYYDSTSLATKSRFHISEVYPYEKLRAMYKYAYKDIAFVKIDKSAANFNLIEFIVNNKQATGRTLTQIKEYCNHDSSFTVGANANFASIQTAINYAYDNYTLMVETGTYNENISLASKLINIVGLGTLESIIKVTRTGGSADSAPVVNIGTDSVFTNMIFDLDYAIAATNPILNIANANPIFNACKIGQNFSLAAGQYKSQKPFTISGTSNVTMNNCIIDAMYNTDGLIKDTANLTFTGTLWRGFEFISEDDSTFDINVDTLATGIEGASGLNLYDDSSGKINVNTRVRTYNGTTGAELADGTWRAIAVLHNDAHLEINGNNIYGGAVIAEDAVVSSLLLKDITTDKGAAIWTARLGAAITNEIKISNCHLTHDVDNNVNGLHFFEDGSGNYNGILCEIEDSYIEFTGYSGNWETWGNPLYGDCRLKMRNVEVVDHINDKVDIGYFSTVGCRNIDFEDVIIRQVDHTMATAVITRTLEVGVTMQIRLKNVQIFNGEQASAIIAITTGARAFDENDWICLDNVTHDSPTGIYVDDSGDAAANFAALQANCP